MTKREVERGGSRPPSQGTAKSVGIGPSDSAFDLWLNRGLHQMFDDIAKEPLPEELLRLIEGNRNS